MGCHVITLETDTWSFETIALLCPRLGLSLGAAGKKLEPGAPSVRAEKPGGGGGGAAKPLAHFFFLPRKGLFSLLFLLLPPSHPVMLLTWMHLYGARAGSDTRSTCG